MNKTTKSSRLQGKDLMNIGIYSAIYCVIVTGVAMLGYIPIMMPMLCALVPLIAGVPFMLFLTKVKEIWNDMDYEYHHRNLYDFNRNGTLCVDCGIFYRLNCRTNL